MSETAGAAGRVAPAMEVSGGAAEVIEAEAAEVIEIGSWADTM
jgi:hypothetical protein